MAKEDFRHRQEVTVRYQGKEPRSFDAVLEKRGDTLKLVGLTPVNTVLFVAELEGRQLRFENRTGEALPFDGSHILRDVQRAFFPWLEGPVIDGRREGRVGDEVVVEVFESGRLRERIFTSPDQPPVRLRFEPSAPEQVPTVILTDEGLAYELHIRTF